MNAEAISADVFSELKAEGTSYQICLPHADTDHIQGRIKTEQTPYELAMLRDMSGRVQADDLFLDIGANVGNHTLYMAMVRRCTVVAFEPNTELCQALRLSADANGVTDRIRVEPYALGEVRGNGRFEQLRPDNLGAQAVAIGSGDIHIVPLDSFVFERQVKVVKIDVEGMEMAVLRGGATLLARDRPIVYVECLNEEQFRAVSRFLSQLNYGYWDTFNSSPTQLFIPNEQLNVDQRLSRLQALAEEGNYRNGYQLHQRRKELDEANRKYRFATEQIAQFKTRITELTAEKTLLDATLSALKDRFEAESLRHRDVDDQLVALRKEREANLEALSATRADLAQVQSEYGLQQERLTHATRELTIGAALAEQAQTLANRQLDDLQKRERETRERCDAELARKEREVESRLLQSEKASAEVRAVNQALREERTQLIAQASDLSAVLHAQETVYRETATAREARIREAERESAELRVQISALREERSSLIVDNDKLAAELATQEQAYRDAVLALDHDRHVLTEKAAAMAMENAAKAEEIALLVAQRLACEEELTRVTSELDVLRNHAEQLAEGIGKHEATFRQKEVDLRNEIVTLQARNQASTDRYEKLSDEQNALRDEFREKEASFENEMATLRNRINALKAEVFEGEALKGQLSSELAVSSALNRSGAAAFEQAKLEAVRNKLALTEANAQIERLRQQLLVANQRVMQTKNTLSFQVGHAFVFATKSFANFRALPGTLWRLHNLAKQRRAEREKASQSTATKIVSVIPRATGLLKSEEHAEAARLIAERAGKRLKGLHDNDGDRLARRLKTLKVASIMDEFTQSSYEPECNLLQLTPAHWQDELDAFQPEMLFIESAWRGKDGLWGSKVGHMSQEVIGIVQWCRERNVPTIFWNKEDPVHFETFLSTAKLFDFIFTTDVDCIHRYKGALGHERVYLLPFAAQPCINNPIEKFERKDAFCFAGAYYARYPERTRDLGNFIVNLPEFRPLEIYDRNYGKDDANYRFPDEYQPFIVGNLPYTEIDKAYKGYRYAINLNSVKQSQSMFARRVYELLASNTITVSNFSRGIRLMFGDLVVTTDSGADMTRRLRYLDEDNARVRKLRLAALRKVMTEHTYQDRIAYIVAKVGAEQQPSLMPPILVAAYAKDQSQADRLIAAFVRQDYAQKMLLLVVPNGFTPDVGLRENAVRIVSAGEAEALTLSSLGSSRTWLSVFVPDDYYGERYLTDLAVATRYSEAMVIGKASYYVWSEQGGLRLQNLELTYTNVAAVPARAGMARLDQFAGVSLREWLRSPYTAQLQADSALAIDEFNYCRNGVDLDESSLSTLCDMQDLDVGLPLAEMLARAEAIAPAKSNSAEIPKLRGKDLAELFSRAPQNSQVTVIETAGRLQVDSALLDGKHEYWNATRDHNPGALGVTDGKLQLHLETTPGLNLQAVVFFLDEKRQRIAHVIKTANRNHSIELPVGTAYLRLGLRIYASGSAIIEALLLGEKPLEPAEMFAQACNLVLTNHYPAYDDLYRNAFVHSRVRAYRKHGVRCDVFRFRANQAAAYDEFEDVDVTTGGAEVLHKILGSGKYRSLLVHFLDEAMWEVLRHYTDRIKVIVWAHGADIQAFHRRSFLYHTDEQRITAMKNSERRMNFWRGLLQPSVDNVHIVFVSRFLASTAAEDLGIDLSNISHSIIHNPIDTDRFEYVEKSADMRKKILSIRPFSSTVYANDLTVKAILKLSREPFFDELEIRIIGDGPMFDEVIDPLRKFHNVIIERKFVNHSDIALLHKQYGVFLCPSRMDTHGVSRDEAMSSGLVPVTTAVAAIPEFVDEKCGILVPAESADEMAAGVCKLVRDPQLFLDMSARAARRVRSQSGSSAVISAELALFNGSSDSRYSA
ncbi:FkbM family methyltransferase [Cupriavidus nantongensis]|uniref:FkbM family methyltransferase n=1 Tax=Cupriavidus nantongensis TaxID=1796606 RepID=UPI00358EF6B1